MRAEDILNALDHVDPALVEAAGQAVGFIHACAVRTVEQDLPLREGVDFEPLLGLLTDKEVP